MSFEEYCNRCGFVTERDHKGEDCPWHQEVLEDSEGVQYLKYDEFDQDGNAY